MKLRWFFGTTVSALLLAVALIGLAGHDSIVAAQDEGSKIEALLLDKFATDGSADYIVQFSEQADLSAAEAMDWNARGEFVYNTLSDVASNSQINAKVLLDAAGLRYQTFIAGNELYVWSGTQVSAEGLAALPEVEYIRASRTYYIDPDVVSNPLDIVSWAGDFLANNLLTTVVDTTDATTDWGILDTHADQAWAYGARGAGIKVANIDTGVQWDHPALVNQFACPGDPTDSDCWEDPSNICPGGSMCDNNGHGTHTMGTMVAKDDPALLYIAGMAPDATWIACKGCESSSCSDYALNTCADWILAPGGDPNNRPNVVNNSWGGGGCDDWYESKVSAWVAAGIFPAFSAGNSNGCGSMGSPGDYQVSFASTGHNVSRAHVYSQGPSCYGHEPYTKPNITAPAASICSTVPGDAWSCGYSGTSMASPHSAGAVAQVWSVCPAYMGQIYQTFELLQDFADLPDPVNPGCGAPPDGEGTYEDGYGYLNVLAAVEECSGGMEAPDINITPTSLLAVQGTDEVTTQQLEVCNLGGDPLAWIVSEVPEDKGNVVSHAPKITLPDGAPTTLGEAAGLTGPVAQSVAAKTPSTQPNSLTFYTNRGDFDAAYPGLPIEGYENGSMPDFNIGAFAHPLDQYSSNIYFDPGDILPGIEFWASTTHASDELAGVGTQFAGNPSKTVVANYFTDSYIIDFDPAVQAAGLDLQEYVGGGTCQVDIYDTNGYLTSVTASCSNAGIFWGLSSDAEPIASLVITDLGGGAEGADNIAFGGGPAGDIPWLSEDPITGTIPGGECQMVDVTFDSTGMDPGDYFGDLRFDSNDPDEPQVNVPVTLEVVTGVPDIVVEPLSLDSFLLPDEQETQELNVCNIGEIDLDWELQEAESPGSVLTVLWDNGPLITHPGACGGMDASRLQTGLGMNTLGFGHQLIYGYRMADDFTITDPEGWQINQITFFAYQTNAPSSPSPITGVYYQIWDGPPDDPGSSIVFGDLVTNRLLSSTSPNMQRDSDTSPCANNRYIFADVADAGVFLPPGTYWIDWMTDGNLSSGPWAPPVTILGETTTGNAIQFTTDWAAALDTGTGTQQDMPFIIEGEIPSVDIPWLSEDPTSGTVLAGECQAVDVTFDSTGLVPDVYIGGLNISSNDPDEPDVFVDVTLNVLFEADLSVVKTASADEVGVGDMITYTLVVNNAGPDDAVGVTMTDTLPALVSFVSASDGCSEESGVVTCDIGDLAMDDSATLYIIVTADTEGIAANIAEVPVPPDYEDPNLDNNVDEVDITISPIMYNFYLPLVQKH